MENLPKETVRDGELASFRKNDEKMKNEIARLAALDIVGLRLAWRNIFAKTAPIHLPKHLLVRIISYHLQANAYGDLDRKVAQILDRRARQAAVANDPVTAKIRPLRILKPGTVLTRESGGKLHRVIVLENGYAWNEATYRSLSEVARAITGTRWNGPRFFGLYQKGPSEQQNRSGKGRTSGDQS
jgi:hypothetical protein